MYNQNMNDYEVILKAISYARDGQKLSDSDANAATEALARLYGLEGFCDIHYLPFVFGQCPDCAAGVPPSTIKPAKM